MNRVSNNEKSSVLRGFDRSIKRGFEEAALKILQDPLVQGLNIFQFARWLELVENKLITPLKSHRSSLQVQQLLQDLLKEKIQNSHCRFFFLSLGCFEEGTPPQFLVESYDFLKDLPQEEGISYSEEAYKDLKSSAPRKLKTKEEVDALFPLITGPSFIPWDIAADGCYYRADLGGTIVKHTGVDPQTIFKQYAFGSFYFEDYSWQYHLAIGIELENGKIRVVDPSVHPKSLKVKEWVLKYKANATEIVPAEEHFNLTKVTFTQKVLLARCSLNEHFRMKKNGDMYVAPQDSFDREGFFHAMSLNRIVRILERNTVLSNCFASFFPTHDCMKKPGVLHSIRVMEKLEAFYKKEESSILVTAKEIEGLSCRLINPNKKLWHSIKHMKFYLGKVADFPIKESEKQSLIYALKIQIGKFSRFKYEHTHDDADLIEDAEGLYTDIALLIADLIFKFVT